MGRITVSELRGGRNGVDSPLSLYPGQCAEALNVDWSQGPLGRKRGGAAALSLAGGTAFSFGPYVLQRHVPTGDEAAAEMWAYDTTPLFKRLAGGAAWADVTTDDTATGTPTDFATLNGKLFVAYDTTVDRLHCYDPALAAPRIRRVGISPTATAPTLADQGVGAYAATLRYYRLRYVQRNGTVVVRLSEPGTAASITPSGVGLSVRITRPALPGEGETHWRIEASTDGVTYFLYGDVVAATTFLDDATATSTYADSEISPVSGYCGLPPSCQFLLSDNNRLLMTGANETGQPTSRIWYTPVLGSADKGDDERYLNTAFQKGYVDLSEKDGGKTTGMAGPIGGIVYVFKSRQIWRLTPTGDSDNPYLPRRISNSVGCIDRRSLVVAEDVGGNPCIYFLSRRGPYRVGVNGIEYLGRDVEDKAKAGGSFLYCHSLYYEELGQIWWHVSTTIGGGGPTASEYRLVLDIRQATIRDKFGIRGGWSVHTGISTVCACSCMFANTVGASMSTDLKPYIGGPNVVGIWKCDTSDKVDIATTFQAYVITGGLREIANLGTNLGARESMVVAKPAAAVTLELKLIRDFGLDNTVSTVLLTAASTETRVFPKFDAAMQSDVGILQAQLGDSAAISSAWSIDALIIETSDQGER